MTDENTGAPSSEDQGTVTVEAPSPETTGTENQTVSTTPPTDTEDVVIEEVGTESVKEDDKPSEDVNNLKAQAGKYASLESENQRLKQLEQQVQESGVLFKGDVDKMLKDPAYKQQREQEWINNPAVYDQFRQEHQKHFGNDLGDLKSYLGGQSSTPTAYDPRIEQVEQNRIAQVVNQTVAQQQAQYDLERQIFAEFPDADPMKATTEEDRQRKAQDLAIAQLQGGDLFQYGRAKSFPGAVKSAYAMLTGESRLKEAEQAGRIKERAEITNQGVGIGSSTRGGTTSGSGKKSYKLKPHQKVEYDKLLSSNKKGSKNVARHFAELCDKENR